MFNGSNRSQKKPDFGWRSASNAAITVPPSARASAPEVARTTFSTALKPQHPTLADALKPSKQGVPRRLIGDGDHFWQKRYCDFNIRKLLAVCRKSCAAFTAIRSSGACASIGSGAAFATTQTGRDGQVAIESERTARKRERAAGRLCPALEPPHSSQNRARVGHLSCNL